MKLTTEFLNEWSCTAAVCFQCCGSDSCYVYLAGCGVFLMLSIYFRPIIDDAPNLGHSSNLQVFSFAGLNASSITFRLSSCQIPEFSS